VALCVGRHGTWLRERHSVSRWALSIERHVAGQLDDIVGCDLEHGRCQLPRTHRLSEVSTPENTEVTVVYECIQPHLPTPFGDLLAYPQFEFDSTVDAFETEERALTQLVRGFGALSEYCE